MKVLCVILLSTVITVCYSQGEEQSWKIYYDSTNLFWNKDWNKALALLKKAEETAVTDLGIYDENYLTIVNDIGLVYWKLQDFPNAEKFLSRTLDLKKEYFATDDSQLFISASNLAGLYAEEGDLKKSKDVYQNFVRPRESIVDSEVYDITLDNLLSLYSLHHSADTALQLIDNLKSKISTTNDGLSNFRIQLFKTRLLRKNRDYETARILLEKLSDELRATPSADQLFIESLYELGAIYTETGFYNHAEKNLLEASNLLKGTGNTFLPLQIKILNSLAFVYEQLDIYDKAIAYYQQSLDLCVSLKGQKSIQCATLKNNIADVWLKNGELTKAIESYESLLESLNGVVAESDPLYPTSLNNLATAYRKNNQQKKALEVLEKALASMHHNRLPENDLTATILNNLAIIHTESGEYHKAAEQYKKSYDIKKSIYGENSIQLLDLVGNLAVVNWAMHKPDAAIPLFKKSMELALRHVRYVFPNLNEAEQVQFYRKLKEDFERFNTMAIQLSDVDPSLAVQMFDNQLAIKSIVFFTQHRRSSILSDSKDSLLAVQFGLVKAKRDELGKLYQSPSHGASASTISKLEKEIDALEKSISLKTSSTEVRNDVNWKVLQGNLKEKDAIVDIIRFRKYDHKDHHGLHKVFGFTDSVYYAALITTKETIQKPELVLFRDGVNFESRFLSYYKNALNFEVDDKFTYNFYWEPIARHLKNKSKIYLSLDGVYHKINLNTLRDPSSGEFVLQKYDIVHVLNAAQILDKRSAKRISHDAVLIGDPVFDVDLEYPASHRGDDFRFGSLPGTMKEVKNIEAILQDNLWRIKTFVKSEATESNLKAVSSPEVLHIASHGYFSTGIVQLNELAKKEFLFHSGLVLAGANKSQLKDNRDFDNDGIVTAYEVMNLELSNTELVVLSACETGLGVVENGEGVHGLQRSFLQAGAKQVLISLWKVDDEVTKELMIRFYQNIVNGKPTREALKQAQLDLINNKYNPYFWGGFVMVGSE